jgi:predicted nucleotidyltransferase
MGFSRTTAGLDCGRICVGLGSQASLRNPWTRIRTLPEVPIMGILVPVMSIQIHALFPGTRAALLVRSFREPDRRFNLIELIRIVGRGRGAVQRELANLTDGGVLIREVSHGRVYYQANRSCPIFPELRSLVEKTAGYATTLREHLAKLEGIRVAFVFGSMAREAAGPNSDIDLAVIGNVGFREVVRAVRPAQELVCREVNPVVYSCAEFRTRAERSDHFALELLSTAKQFILGSQHDLETLAGQRVADRTSDERTGSA